MSSMMAKTPCPYNALYGAAKVFVLSFSTALARELKHTGVSVTTVENHVRTALQRLAWARSGR